MMTNNRAIDLTPVVRSFHALLSTGLLLLAGSLGCTGSHDAATGGSEDEAHAAHVTVLVVPAEERSIERTVSALARCETLPAKLAPLTAALEGQVREILVEQGQPVTAGQPIVAFDTTLAKADLAEKTAALDSLVATLRLLKSVPREQERKATELAIQQAKIAKERAKAVVDSLRPLRTRNEVSEQQMLDAERALAQAEVQEQTAAAQLEALVLGPREEAVAEAEAKIAVAKRAADSSQARLDLHTIRAPIAGRLDSLACRLGQTIPVSTELGVVVDTRQVLALAWLPVILAREIRTDQTVEVHANDRGAPVSADAVHKATEGRVVFLGQVADRQTGNVPVHVLIDNEHGHLVVGQTLGLEIVVEKTAKTLAVPQTAIHDEGEGPRVTVVREGKTVVLKPTLGAAHEGWVAVSGTDLKPGEPVAVEGAYNLPEGTEVQTAPAASGTGEHT
jgi:RND family efflux transporter MFP subunit